MKLATILTILASSALSFGQRIEMSDFSPPGSPVTLSVMVDTEASRQFANVLAHNNAMKGVLAIVVVVQLCDSRGQVLPITTRQDYVFKHGVIGPGNDRGIAFAEWPLELPQSIGSVTAHREANVTPHAEGSVKFVQFDDGSIWGDPQAAKRMLAERPEKLAFLQHLVDVYNMDGEAAFAGTLDDAKIARSHIFDLVACVKADADHDKLPRIDLVEKRLADAQRWQAAGIFSAQDSSTHAYK
jgi:hypothetical protein